MVARPHKDVHVDALTHPTGCHFGKQARGRPCLPTSSSSRLRAHRQRLWSQRGVAQLRSFGPGELLVANELASGVSPTVLGDGLLARRFGYLWVLSLSTAKPVVKASQTTTLDAFSRQHTLESNQTCNSSATHSLASFSTRKTNAMPKEVCRSQLANPFLPSHSTDSAEKTMPGLILLNMCQEVLQREQEAREENQEGIIASTILVLALQNSPAMIHARPFQHHTVSS